MTILGADGKPARPLPQESEAVRTMRRHTVEAMRRNNDHFMRLMVRAEEERRIRELRRSCGLPVTDPFAYVTKDEE